MTRACCQIVVSNTISLSLENHVIGDAATAQHPGYRSGFFFLPDHLDYMQNIAGANFVKFHTYVYDKKA